MSRTHKTKPFWVKLQQGILASQEIHKHGDGVCDLPPPEQGCFYRWSAGQRCHREFRYTGINVCGCGLCSGKPWRNGWEAKNARRQKEQRITRTWSEEYD